MLAVCIPFVAALFCYQFRLFQTYPVLDADPGAGPFACELKEEQHLELYQSWYSEIYVVHERQFYIVGTVYIWASIGVTLVGISLLWLSYRRIARQNQFTSLNTTQLAVHVTAMVLISSAEILNIFNDSLKLNIVQNALSGSFYILLCYIVWTQASSDQLTQYELVVELQHDGTSKFLLRLVA